MGQNTQRKKNLNYLVAVIRDNIQPADAIKNRCIAGFKALQDL